MLVSDVYQTDLVIHMVFPVVMYRCELDHKEGWEPKNWCFLTMVLKKTFEIPLDCKEIKPVNPKGNQPWIFIEGLMLKLKLQYFGHLLWRTNSLEKTLCWKRLKAGGERDDRGWDGWMASPIQWTWVWVNSRRWWRTGKPGMLQSIELDTAKWPNENKTHISFSDSFPL